MLIYHYSPRTNNSPCADLNTRQYCHTSTNHRSLADDNRFKLVVSSIAGNGMAVVAKCRVRTNENIIFYAHSIPNLNAALYCYIIANDNIVFNKAVRADIAVLADLCTRQHNAVLPNASSLANILRLHIRQWMYKCAHSSPLLNLDKKYRASISNLENANSFFPKSFNDAPIWYTVDSSIIMNLSCELEY